MGNEKIKILAIDDNPGNLVALKALIYEAFPQAVIFTALNGKKGLDLALAQNPDIILLDILMPEMDGFEFCMKLKNDNRLSDIPVVFITTQKSDKESRIRAMEADADAFLAKPIDENELTAQIRAMAKIKWANTEKRNEQARLALLAEETTKELKKTYTATLNLLEDLNRENEARKKNEEALRKSEENLADIFQNVNEGIAYCTLSGDVLAINKALEKILEMPAERIIGNNIMSLAKELLTKRNLKKALPMLKIVMKGKNIETFQIELKGKIIETSATINSESKRIIGVLRDVTQSRLAEEELRRSETRFRTLVENAFDGIYLTNGKYFYFVNDKFCDIVGYSAEELTAPDFDFMVTMTEDSNNMVQERANSRRMGKNVTGTYEIQIITKDGDFKIVEVSTVNLGSVKVLNVMGIVRDITERRRIETQIIQSERLSALGEMSAGMAHEINQPLNTLSMLFDNILFEARVNKAVSEEYLMRKSEKIYNNILRIRNLIDHVRDFSRSRDGYILNLFSINKSVLNALSMVSEQFRIAGIDIITNLDANLPQVKGNLFKFEQVILNLISNSKDAIFEKKERLQKAFPMFIKISTRSDKQNIYVVFEDSGVGIKQEIIDKILQPFFTTKDPGKGTGLGLSIIYGHIKELDGKIEIRSDVMKGTTVSITIPLKNNNI
jgi:PAS domain S-box-containing protein